GPAGTAAPAGRAGRQRCARSTAGRPTSGSCPGRPGTTLAASSVPLGPAGRLARPCAATVEGRGLGRGRLLPVGTSLLGRVEAGLGVLVLPGGAGLLLDRLGAVLVGGLVGRGLVLV